MLPHSLRPFLTRRVVLSAITVGFLLGLLFEGVMIGSEYRRSMPPYLLLFVLMVVLLFVLAVWHLEEKKR